MDLHAMITGVKPIRRRRQLIGRWLCIASCLGLAAAAIAALKFGWLL